MSQFRGVEKDRNREFNRAGTRSGNQRRFPFLIEPRDFRVNHHRGGKLKKGRGGIDMVELIL